MLFDEENLIELCCYYLGTLKTSKDREETVYKYWDFPKGKPSAVVEKGLDQQGRVYMCFGGKLPASKDLETGFYESEIMEQLEALFDIRLREVIREDKSGSYGIGLNGYIDGYPERFYRFEIDFGCEPERCQELAAPWPLPMLKVSTSMASIKRPRLPCSIISTTSNAVPIC